MLEEAVESALRGVLGTDFRLAGDALAGKIEGTRGERFFLKLRPAAEADRLSAEVDGLRALAESETFKVPTIIVQGEVGETAFLATEHLDLKPLSHANGAHAGEALATLHAPRSGSYGWRRDNYIGATLQHNAQSESWPIFFASQRLRPQLALAASKGYRGALQQHGEHICEKIAAFFLEYRPAPALLHGDLWNGNIGELPDGAPALFDPAVCIGDRETDVAMTELFGGFPESFYATYRRARPLDFGYEQRKQLYNLYHMLNHLNLFGRSYLRQVEWMATKLFDELRH